MPKDSVFCLALSRGQANRIVKRVRTSGFSINDVSALFPDWRPAWWTTARRSGFASFGALAIPGVGPFIAAGPIIFRLSGAFAVGVGGGLTGALVCMGMSEIEATLYESRIREGNILISVRTENSDEINRAKATLMEAGAQDICATGEFFTPMATKATNHATRPTKAARSHARP